MRRLIFLAFICFVLASGITAQTDCPADKVCLSQETANKLFSVAEQLIEAKNVIAKFQTERATADVALNSALKVIEGWKELDQVNGQIIAKKDQIITLYEKTIQIQQSIIESLEKRLLKPKSSFSKFMDALKTLTYFAAGIILGRGI